MQFSQPNYFGPQLPSAYNSPFQFNGYPEIIGEGNVTSVLSPDGSTQLLFLPVQSWKPSPTPYVAPNWPNPYWNNFGAWVVRNIINPFQPNVFSQPSACPCSINLKPGNSECCVENNSPGYQLKFHNDSCTSTSDINIFCPNQYNWWRRPQASASTQVDVPVPMITDDYCRYQTMGCSKQNNFTPRERYSTKQVNFKKINSYNKCQCKEPVSDKSLSTYTDHGSDAMSCDSGTQVCDKKHLHMKSSLLKNKSVNTCTDHGTVCGNGTDRETQTAVGCSPVQIFSMQDSKCKKENRKPNRQRIKKAAKNKSAISFKGRWDSCSCSSTSQSDHKT